MKKINGLALSLFNYFIIYLFLEAVILVAVDSKFTGITRFFTTLTVFVISIYASREYFKTKFFPDCLECLDRSVLLGVYTFLPVFINLTLSSIQRTVFNSVLTTANNELIIETTLDNPVLTGFIVILFLPVMEELLFKYQLFSKTEFLKRNWLFKTFFLAMLFASLHCLTEIASLDFLALISFLNYFLFYFITNLIYKSKGNLMMPVTIHCLYNAVSYILIF